MAGFRVGDRSVCPDASWAESQPRLRVGDDGHVATAPGLAETFVVAEQEQVVLLDGAAQRAAELVAAEGRNGCLVEESRAHRARCCAGIRTSEPCRLLVPDCVTTLTCAPARLPYSAPIGVGEDVEFAHGVDAQQFAADAAGGDGELAGSGVLDAVEKNRILSPGRRPATENVLPLLVLVFGALQAL